MTANDDARLGALSDDDLDAEREAERRARIDAHHAEEAAQGNL